MSSSDSAASEIKRAASPAPAAFEHPLDRYRPQNLIASQALSKLTLATDLKTKAHVVLKQTLMLDGITQENPIAEAEMLQSLSSKHIVKLLDRSVSRDQDGFVSVLEFCAGGDLFSVAARGAVDEKIVKQLFAQIVDGVSVAHAAGIAHLDLKPENFLLTEALDRKLDCYAGTVKLCDFGLARYVSAGETIPAERVGTEQYMAPELFRGTDASCDPFAADIWSLGVTLYVLLVGAPPFLQPTLDDEYFFKLWTGRSQNGASVELDSALADVGRGGNVAALLAHFGKNHLSASAVDLLSKMLCVAHSRATLADIVSHPWLASATAAASLSLRRTNSGNVLHRTPSSCSTSARSESPVQVRLSHSGGRANVDEFALPQATLA